MTRSELALLGRLCHPDGPDGAVNPFSAVETRTVDWDRFGRLALEHGVSSLVWRWSESLRRIAPTATVDRLEQRHRTIATRHLAMGSTLVEVVETLRSTGIRALPVKGPVLDTAVYGDQPRRDYGDLDVLVPRERIDEAIGCLGAHGFDPPEALPPPSAGFAGGLVRPPMLEEYSLHRDGIEVELRWQLGDTDRPFHPGFDELWHRRGGVELAGETVPALDPLDRLQLLAYHGTKHGWHRLKWVCDVSWCLNTLDQHPSAALETATINGNRRRVQLGAALGDRLLGTDLTNGFDRPDGKDVAKDLADRAADRLMADPTGRPRSTWRLWYNLRACDTHRDRVKMLSRYRPLHPSVAEYRFFPLPPRWYPLYYLLRPFRLAHTRVVR